MNINRLKAKAAIVGIGDSYCARDERRTALSLLMEAIRKALDDAGIEKGAIDGLLSGRAPMSDMRPQWNNIVASYAKITPRLSTEITTHAGGMNGMLKHAAIAVEAGVAEYVLCVGADAAAGLMDVKEGISTLDADPEFEQPYGVIIPTLYAQIASRLMHESGVTEEDISSVSVQCQDWAIHHPFSAKGHKGPITAEMVMASRMVSSPLRLWHCATWGPPGTAGAMIVTRAENARHLSREPIYLHGFGEFHTHEYITDRMGLRTSAHDLGRLPNLTTSGAKVAAEAALQMSGMGLDELHVLQTASQFAHIELMVLAEFGFISVEAAGAFIRAGETGPRGRIPTNTNGGWLSFGQPGVSCVMDSLVEAVRQLRGTALGLQVPAAVTGAVHSNGGINACHNVLILSRNP
ncbi:acetyl-CoA acetyltransferase [Rhodoligotrophos appendicifer]|uniref:thiolase family protein n=1 Tax=Rhodoligotrophos appendicifer TaxID=987056 RepID=UPI001185EE5B|nr:thiolase family protein [Rhodoligotrophos appendicifer]